MSLVNVKLIDFPKISDSRGDLSFIENSHHIPFEIKRVFYLYNLIPTKPRGSHAHKKTEQVLISLYGQFEVSLNDGISKKTFSLNTPSQGLYIPPLIWNDLNHFSEKAICLVLASEYYDEKDYYRNYEEFNLDVKKAS